MQQMKLNLDKILCSKVPKLGVVAILLMSSFPTRSVAQKQGQKTFSSAEDAGNALVAAAQSYDEKMMLDILGPTCQGLISLDSDSTSFYATKAYRLANTTGGMLRAE